MVNDLNEKILVQRTLFNSRLIGIKFGAFNNDLNVNSRPYRERQRGLFSFLETHQAPPDAVIWKSMIIWNSDISHQKLPK